MTREVWITGCGLVSALGEGEEAHWQGLAAGDPLARADSRSFAPFHVYPMAPLELDRQIPRKGDQRAMGPLMQYGAYAAGMALAEAGVAGDAALLGRTHLIAAAGGGERDAAVDEQILAAVAGEAEAAKLNALLAANLRPTLFLAQLPNLFAGNISIVHGVAGSSRTFMSEEQAGIDAARIAWERIAAGQGDLFLVGGACNACRWDLLLLYQPGGVLLTGPLRRLWDRPKGGICLGSAGAFLVLEARAHAEARGARPLARLEAVLADRCDRAPGAAAQNARRQWEAFAPRLGEGPVAVLSGACGSGPITAEERGFWSELAAAGAPVALRGTAAALGHAVEASFLANLILAISCIRRQALFPPLDPAEPLERRETAGPVRQAVVSGWGHRRGEGMALVRAP